MLEVDVVITGADLGKARFWDEQAMAELCAASLLMQQARTQKGTDATGHPFKTYSTNPIYISFDSETAKRLKPKGGRVTKSGKSMYFEYGYQEFKDKGRLGSIESAEVDLTLSGQMLREVDVVKATEREGIISVRGQSRRYATHVNDDRPFLGHHEAEMPTLVEEMAARSEDAFARSQQSSGGSSPPTEPVT